MTQPLVSNLNSITSRDNKMGLSSFILVTTFWHRNVQSVCLNITSEQFPSSEV